MNRRVCSSLAIKRHKLAQGLNRWWGDWGHLLLHHGVAGVGLLLAGAADAACPGPQLDMRPVAGLPAWVVWAAPGDADAHNRGQVSNLWVVREGRRVWLLGSGPSPAWGRALACQLKQRTGWTVSDVVNAWARPELALGNRAFAGARLWAHADVAQAMTERCPHCEQRLRQRLGAAASDLGPSPIQVATHRMQGEHGQLGPWQWWRLWRGPGTAVTVWRLRQAPLWAAPGLLWADGPPDLRDTDSAHLNHAWQRLQALAQDDGAAARWLPEQGDWQPAQAPAQALAYLAHTRAAVAQAQAQGGLETDAPPPLPPGLPRWMGQGQRPGLNWQRLWRQMEAEDGPTTAPAVAPPTTAPSVPSLSPGL